MRRQGCAPSGEACVLRARRPRCAAVCPPHLRPRRELLRSQPSARLGTGKGGATARPAPRLRTNGATRPFCSKKARPTALWLCLLRPPPNLAWSPHTARPNGGRNGGRAREQRASPTSPKNTHVRRAARRGRRRHAARAAHGGGRGAAEGGQHVCCGGVDLGRKRKKERRTEQNTQKQKKKNGAVGGFGPLCTPPAAPALPALSPRIESACGAVCAAPALHGARPARRKKN